MAYITKQKTKKLPIFFAFSVNLSNFAVKLRKANEKEIILHAHAVDGLSSTNPRRAQGG